MHHFLNICMKLCFPLIVFQDFGLELNLRSFQAEISTQNPW